MADKMEIYVRWSCAMMFKFFTSPEKFNLIILMEIVKHMRDFSNENLS